MDLRKHLKEVANVDNKFSDSLTLTEERDFMEYLSGDVFDYIIMNPPYNIKLKGKPVYDVDFILHAYKMLKAGGVLVALASRRFTTDKIFEKKKAELMRLGATITPVVKQWKASQLGEISKEMKTEVAVVQIVINRENYDLDF
jgi:predicted membrane-bound spermidine synthase